MIKNEGARVWVNRFFAFLAGGLIVLAIMSLAAVAPLKSQNETLAKQLDDVQNGAARLLGEARSLAKDRSYQNALRTLNTLFEKQVGSSEAIEGKKLYAEIETAVLEGDRKWEAASVAVRLAWEMTTAAEMRAKLDGDRDLMEKSMVETLKKEWEKSRDKVRQQWENREI